MKSRLAILSMLVAGMLMSTTGAGLAVTSLSTNDASVAQYGGTGGQGDHGGGNKGGTLGEGDQGGGTTHHSTTPNTPSTVVQPTRQLETGASSGNLPFTGFLAIPVLLGGVALLGAGLVLRRRSAPGH